MAIRCPTPPHLQARHHVSQAAGTVTLGYRGDHSPYSRSYGGSTDYYYCGGKRRQSSGLALCIRGYSRIEIRNS